jgi:hypothetical protein
MGSYIPEFEIKFNVEGTITKKWNEENPKLTIAGGVSEQPMI